MKVGFIGLGNVGGKLAGSLLRNGYDLMVRDLDREIAQPFVDGGARFAESPREMAEQCDLVITCLPSPAASAVSMFVRPVTPIGVTRYVVSIVELAHADPPASIPAAASSK